MTHRASTTKKKIKVSLESNSQSSRSVSLSFFAFYCLCIVTVARVYSGMTTTTYSSESIMCGMQSFTSIILCLSTSMKLCSDEQYTKDTITRHKEKNMNKLIKCLSIVLIIGSAPWGLSWSRGHGKTIRHGHCSEHGKHFTRHQGSAVKFIISLFEAPRGQKQQHPVQSNI